MKAVILAAGFGKRLKEITAITPKALVPVAGKPVILWIIEKLINTGVSEILINLHYKGEDIKNYLESLNLKVIFKFFFEKEILDTGGALKNMQAELQSEEFFILHNCDVLSDISITKMIEVFKAKKPAALLAVSLPAPDRAILFNKDLDLCVWINGDAVKVNAAKDYKHLVPYNYNCIQIISGKLLSSFPETPSAYSVFTPYLQVNSPLLAYDSSGCDWTDIGTPADLDAANTNFTGQILESLLAVPKKDLTQTAKSFVGCNYNKNPLPKFGEKELLISDFSFDCVTFLEAVLSIYFSSDKKQYLETLQSLRYFNSEVSWIKRKHYFSDWLNDNSKAGFLTRCEFKDKFCIRRKLSCLKNYPEVEAEIELIPANHDPADFNDGNIIAFATTYDDLDYRHSGIYLLHNNIPSLLHASGNLGRVLIEPLSEFLKRFGECPGITVVRVN